MGNLVKETLESVRRQRAEEKELNKQFNTQTISIYSKCTTPSENRHISLGTFIDQIKEGTYKKEIVKIRSIKNHKERSFMKAKLLPCVCFSARLSYRNNQSIDETTGLGCLDFDFDKNLSNDEKKEKAKKLKEEISKDPHVFLCFESPSHGIKTIIYIPKVKDDVEYKIVYDQLLDYYKKYSPDTDFKTKDISRLCFVSYDPKLYQNDLAKKFDVDFSKKVEVLKEANTFEKKDVDQSRSGKEFAVVCNLVKKGLSDSEINDQMQVYAKWTSASKGYQDATIKNARAKTKENMSQIPSDFIFDESEIIQKKIFSFFENNNKAGIGLLIPKTCEVYNKQNEIIGYEQKDTPLVIFSDRTSKQYSKHFQTTEKIKFEAIPSCSERRWSLNSIKQYLQGKSPQIDGNILFNKIKKMYKEYMFYSNDWWYEIHSLWDIGTYFFLLFKAYPLIELRGVRGSAKTKTMTISSFITFNATQIMTNPSESTLFRETHERRPTKYIDECEKLFQIIKGKVESDPRVEVINSSYHFKGSVPRQEKIGNRFKTVSYSTYSPTMIASINGLYGATEDRAIVHISVKTQKNDLRGELEPEDNESFSRLRDTLYIYALQNWKGIKESYDNLKNETNLKNRDYQIWKPLLAIAKYIDVDLYERIVSASEKLVLIKDDAILEGSVESKIIITFYSLLSASETGYINTTNLRKHYVYLFGSEYAPSITHLGRKISDLGLREYKTHTRDGNGYKINLEVFDGIISPIMPNYIQECEKKLKECGETLQTIHNPSQNKETNSKMKKTSEEQVKDCEPKKKKDVKDVKVLKGCEGGKGCEGLIFSSILKKETSEISHENLCKKAEVDSDEAYLILSGMAKKGEIYQPKPGFWKIL